MDQIAPNISLRLSNTPDDVNVVRGVLGAFAALLELDPLEGADIDTAVTETCMNVVRHAYDGARGPMEVDIGGRGDELEVTVRDRGIGIRPHIGERRQPHTRLGMPIVHAHTSSLLFRKRSVGGTEVRMTFSTPGAVQPGPPAEQPPWPDGGEHPASGRLDAMLAPPEVARAILPRLLGALAAQAGIPPDRRPDVERFCASVLEATGLEPMLLAAAPGACELHVSARATASAPAQQLSVRSEG